MSLEMSMTLRCTGSFEMRHELKVPSRYLKSCFPKTEKLVLQNKAEVLVAFKWNPTLTKQMPYVSVMDMVLCNLMPYYKISCKRFYKGYGEQLIAQLPKPQIDFIDLQLYDKITELLNKYKEGL